MQKRSFLTLLVKSQLQMVSIGLLILLIAYSDSDRHYD